MRSLEAISPIDGRYRGKTKSLAEFFSEEALIKYRLKVELEYFIFLSECGQIKIRNFSKEEKVLTENFFDFFSAEDADLIKKIETEGVGELKAVNHDVKAVEYFIKMKLKNTTLTDCLEWIHFGLTSEDVNNLAYGLMIGDGIEKVVLSPIEKILEETAKMSSLYKNIPMLSRTHGQPASPTTFGKEFKIFYSRLKRQTDQLNKREISTKLNGATGNYNAHFVAFPEIDWVNFSKNFIEKFNQNRKIKLEFSFFTSQIESHDSYAELFDNFRRLNVILIDFCQDIWRYISDGWLSQKTVDGEVGSSTMPHKINPIDFENAEGNLGMANALFGFFSSKLPISRLQRDLSDSTVERNFGVAFAHSVIAYNSILKGLGKVVVNKKKVSEDLEKHPEVVAEAIQTVLRTEGVEMPYEKLKELTRGKQISLKDFSVFIDSLEISAELKQRLKNIAPSNYIGLADYLTGF